MHSTDDVSPVPEKKARWKKCPICEDSVYISETRPVRWSVDKEASQLMEGGDVCLKLLKREPGSTLALPKDAADNYGKQDDIPWYHVAEIMDYARFMKGGEQYMKDQYDKEISELDAQEKEDELMFGDETTWTRKAVAAIREAKVRLDGMGDPPHNVPAPASADSVLHSWEDEISEPEAAPAVLTAATRNLSISTSTSDPKPEQSTHANPTKAARLPFYFYSALPNFYLSPLDIRILKAAFGEFSAFPTTILPRVEHISMGHIVDDELRKRAKYIGHLPHGCEVSFLECDWTDIIHPSILEQFSDDISRRRKRNTDKEAREERDRMRAEREEDARLAHIRRQRPPGPEKSFSDTDFIPLTQNSAEVGSVDSALGSSPPWANHRTHSSFATLTTPGTSPDAPRTVWGTAAVVGPASPPLIATIEQPRPVDDGWLQGWERDLMAENDIALVEASINSQASGSQAAALSGGGARKGKKKKQITVFSTGGARRGA
ncbi:putative RING finger protein [Cyphellophora attinorum]|uniref:Putative RING finger protein n=1 Tax=Cyphellophora attinorum TaxID=1664694 RepID=A0A0N0NI49_9EURO|nr:putative RING finger protein [Phialophora attinorum]KPI35431.1 putative RING finger protein [Phialophora attinorum]